MFTIHVQPNENEYVGQVMFAGRVVMTTRESHPDQATALQAAEDDFVARFATLLQGQSGI